MFGAWWSFNNIAVICLGRVYVLKYNILRLAAAQCYHVISFWYGELSIGETIYIIGLDPISSLLLGDDG